MNKENNIHELEKILKDFYPLLPLEKGLDNGVFTIKDLAKEVNNEIVRKLEAPSLPGTYKDWDSIFSETLKTLKIDSKKDYLKRIILTMLTHIKVHI